MLTMGYLDCRRAPLHLVARKPLGKGRHRDLVLHLLREIFNRPYHLYERPTSRQEWWASLRASLAAAFVGVTANI